MFKTKDKNFKHFKNLYILDGLVKNGNKKFNHNILGCFCISTTRYSGQNSGLWLFTKPSYL